MTTTEEGPQARDGPPAVGAAALPTPTRERKRAMIKLSSRTTLLAAAAIAGTVLLAGCGDETAETSTELAITGTDDLTFEPDTVAVPAGEEVTVELTSEPSVDHDLVVAGAAAHGRAGDDGHGDDTDEHATDSEDLHVAHADPGQTVTATFSIDEPGGYELYCSVPGHRSAGMTGELTVVDAGA